MRLLSALLAASLAVSGCSLDVPVVEIRPSDPATETFHPSLNVNLAAMSRTASGVYYQDVTAGTGTAIDTTGTITARYTLRLTNGFVVEQLAVPVALTIPALIPGFRHASGGQPAWKEGGLRRMIIPSALAYGPSQNGPIPPNSTLIFDVEFVSNR